MSSTALSDTVTAKEVPRAQPHALGGPSPISIKQVDLKSASGTSKHLDATSAPPPAFETDHVPLGNASPLAIYARSLRSWLHSSPHQAAIAAVAILGGALCLWDGPALWHVIFTVAVAVVGAFVAH